MSRQRTSVKAAGKIVKNSKMGTVTKSFAEKILDGLNSQRISEEKYCDVTLIVNENRYPCHRAVLAAASSYFHIMFHGDFKESALNEVTLKMDEVGLKGAIEYIYKGTVELQKDTVIQILNSSIFYHLNDLTEKCFSYMTSNLDNDNAFTYYNEAHNHKNMKLFNTVKEHIEFNFYLLATKPDFLELCYDLLGLVLESDSLSIENEVDVFKAVERWVEYDWDKRIEYASDLLKLVRFQLITSSELLEFVFGTKLMQWIINHDYYNVVKTGKGKRRTRRITVASPCPNSPDSPYVSFF